MKRKKKEGRKGGEREGEREGKSEERRSEGWKKEKEKGVNFVTQQNH